MATRALIGYLDENREFTCTYNHYDGYPDYLGKILLNHFDNDAAANKIANTGYISNIDEDGTINSKYNESADSIILDDESFSAAMQIGEKVNEYSGDYGYVWTNNQWNTIKNNGIEGMAKQIEEELDESGMFMVDENKKEEEDIMKEGYEAKWAKFLNEAQELDFSVIKKFIQDDLKRGDEEDFALDAYIESIKKDFEAGDARRSGYDDYEMDDYVEDFENYISDKMDS
tara:strand:- start:27 stop:713 length:687 start_codon:yes stop_codon:yes gene_type:complete